MAVSDAFSREGLDSVLETGQSSKDYMQPKKDSHGAGSLSRGTMEDVLNSIIDKFPESAPRGRGRVDLRGSTSKYSEKRTITREVPVFVPKVEVHEIVREEPKIEIEWVEKRVEVPQVQYEDVYEEVVQVKYVPKHVPKIEIIEVPKEVIKHVPRIEIKTVEHTVHVPSGVQIPIPKFVGVAAEIVVPNFYDRQVPVVMSQQIVPEITETKDIYEVPVAKYVPHLVPVDVFIPKPVQVPAKHNGVIEEVAVPVANPDQNLLQQLTIEMNPHLQQLEEYNTAQEYYFENLKAESARQAAPYNFKVPMPILLPKVKMPPTAYCDLERTAPILSAELGKLYQRQRSNLLADRASQYTAKVSADAKQSSHRKSSAMCRSGMESRRTSSLRSDMTAGSRAN